MDPNALLKLIVSEFDNADNDNETDWEDRCYDLKEWLDKGGFPPNWEKNGEGWIIYRYWYYSVYGVWP